jgi:hypothetical protein
MYRGRFRTLGDRLESYTRITQRGTITMLINPPTTTPLFPLVTSMTGDREAHPKITFGYNNFLEDFRTEFRQVPLLANHFRCIKEIYKRRCSLASQD